MQIQKLNSAMLYQDALHNSSVNEAIQLMMLKHFRQVIFPSKRHIPDTYRTIIQNNKHLVHCYPDNYRP